MHLYPGNHSLCLNCVALRVSCSLFKAEGTYEWNSIALNRDSTDRRVVVLVSEPHKEFWCTGVQQGKPNHRRKKEDGSAEVFQHCFEP